MGGGIAGRGSVPQRQAQVRSDRWGQTQSPAGGGVDGCAAASLVAAAVKEAKSGDRDALGFLYARFAENVHGYVFSIVRDSHDAEEITQHVFVKLLGVIDRYEEREVPFLAWLLRVARNVALDHLRCRRLVPVAEVRADDRREAVAPDGSATQLREALSLLPSDQREVVVLRHVAGLSPTEIAARTGRTESSVHGLHHRGRRSLTAELARRGVAPITAVAGSA